MRLTLLETIFLIACTVQPVLLLDGRIDCNITNWQKKDALWDTNPETGVGCDDECEGFGHQKKKCNSDQSACTQKTSKMIKTQKKKKYCKELNTRYWYVILNSIYRKREKARHSLSLRQMTKTLRRKKKTHHAKSSQQPVFLCSNIPPRSSTINTHICWATDAVSWILGARMNIREGFKTNPMAFSDEAIVTSWLHSKNEHKYSRQPHCGIHTK